MFVRGGGDDCGDGGGGEDDDDGGGDGDGGGDDEDGDGIALSKVYNFSDYPHDIGIDNVMGTTIIITIFRMILTMTMVMMVMMIEDGENYMIK